MHRRGRFVVLRELATADLDRAAEMWGDPGATRYLTADPMSRQGAAEALREALRSAASPRRRTYHLAIAQPDDDTLVGSVAVNREGRSSAYVHSFVLHPQARNLSLAGAEAARLTAAFCFEELGLHRFWCMCREDNTNARRLYLGLGMQEQGLFREVDFKEGRWHNHLVFDWLAPQWAERRRPPAQRRLPPTDATSPRGTAARAMP
ncbi:GNAT family N-acetyltransferase [Streptomyces omiyaensis]|uniref:GNAT family N-acetyltransferase n=1 Tax=Streptomyces omiyaensis TaxID=68247 RepID=A0ABW7BQC2_9ACTN|nr:GNAT family protein [Streptomyces omiyaensis]GGY41318.1 N-acetyltransferase [Streptomyces omiyaensis]